MPTRFFVRFLVVVAVLLAATQVYASGVYITEWMYSGADGEFVEFTNLSGSAIDFTGWSYADSDQSPGDVALSAFGLVAAGESVILTEAAADAFRTAWGLSSSVKVIGGNDKDNLGRNDEINLYDASDTLVDRLTYGDQDYSGTIRTQNASGQPDSSAALGANHVDLWVLSELGDAKGSYASIDGDIASPGTTAVPVPGAAWLLGSGLVGLVGFVRRRAA
jgi:predicted extracellular nuclease